jgi:hypothetical protein
METKAEDRAAECSSPAVLARAVPRGDANASLGACELARLLAEWLALCDACDADGPDISNELICTRRDLETRIIETPAANVAELLLKGRVAKRYFDDRETAAFWAGRLLADDAARLAAS